LFVGRNLTDVALIGWVLGLAAAARSPFIAAWAAAVAVRLWILPNTLYS